LVPKSRFLKAPAGNFGFVLPDGTFDPEIVGSRSHTLRTTLNVLRAAQLSATATYTQVRGQEIWSGFAGLTIVFGSATTISATHSRPTVGSESTSAEINRSLPVGVGYGYRLSASDVQDGSAFGQFEVNTKFNRLRLNYDVAEGGDRQNGSATLSGGLIVAGGGLFFTRPLESAAAVVEVTGLPGVRILADNVEVARTGRSGKAVVPRLLPYLANRISFEEADIPFDYKLPEESQLIAPPSRGAAYVKFVTSRIQARSGRVRLSVDGVETVPSYGTIVVTLPEGDVESPLNADGEFFLDLPDGPHQGTVTFQGKSCVVELEAGESKEMVQQLGVVRCAP
jgi:outer membrane usher protein